MAYSAVIPHRWHQMFIANRESLPGLNYLTLIALAGKLIKYVLELSLVQIDCVLRDGFFSSRILMRNDNLFLRSWYLFGFDLPKTQSCTHCANRIMCQWQVKIHDWLFHIVHGHYCAVAHQKQFTYSSAQAAERKKFNMN